jgi:SagB-type dehydrogenase family enzyme
MPLPPPDTKGKVSVEETIKQRRTLRTFNDRSLELRQIAQLLWAAYGVTEDNGFKRSAPSAGALYPMDVYLAVGPESVTGLEAGVYHYEPGRHALSSITGEDRRQHVARASLGQIWMARAPINVVITAEYDRSTGKYGDRGARYALIEAGHIGQNIFLQAEALGLNVGIVGAFRDRVLSESLSLPPTHAPLLVMPVGYPV